MRNTILPFDELMKAVLEQLKSQKYMDSTLTVYRRTYNRIHIFLNHHGTDIYTHELGKAFLAESTTPVQALKHCARAPTSPAHSTCLLLLLRKTKSGVCWHHGFSLYI